MLVMMSAQELANGIPYSGHVYAMTRTGRHLTPAGDLQETFGGMEQVRRSWQPECLGRSGYRVRIWSESRFVLRRCNTR